MTIRTWLAACALLVAAVACGASSESLGDGAPSGGAGGGAQGGSGGAQGGEGGEGGASQGGAGGGTTQVCQPGFARRCYGGPEGTAEIGLCRAGIELCLDDGSGFGACLGEVRPAASESCTLPLDEDCDGAIDEDCACAPGSVRECFSGPENALDVGPCRGGLMACREDGSGYGPCRGEVTPGEESCATPEDDDCSGAANEGCLCTPGEERACYEGPVGTLGLGSCVPGVERCAPDGRSFGACVGQVLPLALDVCDNVLDDDCNGLTDDSPDLDGDGYTRCGGDCCDVPGDCPSPLLVNPGALELPTEPGAPAIDDDCDGFVDEPVACDAGLPLAALDPMDGARAIGLCGGVSQAAWTGADGRPLPADLRAGIVDSFGPNGPPREGASLLVLSTGAARRATDPGACGSDACSWHQGTPPASFPMQANPMCPIGDTIHDDVALTLTLTAPTNAVGFAFDHRFFSFEYPEWVCTQFNDEFVVILSPAPAAFPTGNVAWDAQGNVVSVNSPIASCASCADAGAALVGTGFDAWDDAGATDWMSTQVEIQGGQTLQLRFAIWDTGDGSSDSTVLVDNFRWIAAPPP